MPFESVEIIEAKSAHDMGRFIKFPFKLYKHNKNWVPPLISERKAFFDRNKNPFFRYARVKYFLAKKDGQVAGRIASIVNFNHNAFHEDTVGFFGFFECIDDYEVASVLFRENAGEVMKEIVDRYKGFHE